MRLLHKILREAEGLTYLELVKLDEVIHRLLDSRMVTEAEIRECSDREVVERKQVGRITYQLERVRCGKPTCKCLKGNLHGPYWYGYWLEGGRTKSMYVGKHR
jgi:Family of unknown function (DUF6788)